MLEEAAGSLAGGALWGLGAGIVLTVARGSAPTLRWVTRRLMSTYVAVADSIQEAANEARAERGAQRGAQSRAVAPTPTREAG